MFFSTKKDKVVYGALFEIGSGSIAGAIVSSNSESEKPVILYTTREFIPLKQIAVDEDLTKRLLTTFLNVALDIQSKIPKYLPKKAQIYSVDVNFTAPWAYTRGNTHTYKSEEPVIITHKLLEQIKNSTTKKLAKKVGELDVYINNFTLIDRTIIEHTANGYATDNPVGQKINELTTTETISAVTNTMFKPVQEIIIKLFNDTKTKYSTSALVQQHLLRSQLQFPSTFSVIHLTYEAIELTIYRDSEIITAFTAPIGINTMSRNMAQKSKLPHEQIFSFITSEDTTAYDETLIKRIQKAFESSILPPLAEFFANAQSSELLPRDFYLATTILPSPAIIHIITKALKESSNTRFVLHNLQIPAVHNSQNANIGSGDLGICVLANFFHNNSLNY